MMIKTCARQLSLAALICLCIVAGNTNAMAAELLGVRFGPNGDKTRIVVDISNAPQFEVAGDSQEQGRLIIDFANVPSGLKGANGKGHVAHYKSVPLANGGTRITIALKRTARIEDLFLLEPSGKVKKHRLVIDLRSASKKEFLASLPSLFTKTAQATAPINSAKPQPATSGNNTSRKTITAPPPAPSLKPVARLELQANAQSARAKAAMQDITRKQPQPEPATTVTQIVSEEVGPPLNDQISTPAQRPRKSPSQSSSQKLTIVIDPGHGGNHPGAVGQKGTLEKDVNLAAANSLAKELISRKKYRVVMTRSADRLVDLTQRATIARNVGADLFISLHADGNDDHTLRGSSVYTLSEKGAKRSVQEAREQGNYDLYGVDIASQSETLGNILFDVAHDRNKSASASFANILLNRVSKVTPLVKNAKRTEDLKVLLRPDVPAVLFEMAFISNTKDEKNLTNPAWRKKTMTAVADAIDDYFAANDVTRHATGRASSGTAATAGGLNR